MYKPFFNNNPFAYVEFAVLFLLFLYLLYKNIKIINIFYMNKFNTIMKVIILLITIIFNSLIYLLLDLFNINWVFVVMVNAFMLSIIVYLTISIFFDQRDFKI